MRRLYFLLPSVDVARKTVDELLLARVPEKHIHLLAKRGTPLEDLPAAHMAQKSDLIPALERGAALGGATGAIAGLAAVALPTGGLILGGGAVLALAVAGAGLGAWASSLMGISTPNSQLQQFEEAIERGEILMMVDVPKDQIEATEKLIVRLHPEAQIGGVEPTLPPFP